ncbi:MAG: hypothetical protein ABFS16_01200 [Bacteroidota bacterium]
MGKYLFLTVILLFLFQSCTNKNEFIIEVFFEELQINSVAGLRGLHVVDENVIWASGSKGTVLVSADGGESWKVNQISGEEENEFRSIHAWDNKRAMVFGVAGPDFGYKTIDGGENWEVVYRDTTKGLFFNSLKFADSKNGLAVSDPVDGKFFLIKTEDAGITWKRISDLPEVMAGEANFAASNTCIEFLPTGKAWIASGGKAARVFRSEDFGETWQVSETQMVSGQASSGIFSVAFKNNREGVIVGGTYNKPELNENIAAYTIDGGKSWQPAETMPKEYRSCVQSIVSGKTQFLFAIGKTGYDYSCDDGKSWQHLGFEGYYTFRQVPGKSEGFAAGANGEISKIKFKKL